MANKDVTHILLFFSFPGVEIQSKTFEKSVGSRSRTPSIKAATAASASLKLSTLKFHDRDIDIDKEDEIQQECVFFGKSTHLGSAAKSVSAKSLTFKSINLSISQPISFHLAVT